MLILRSVILKGTYQGKLYFSSSFILLYKNCLFSSYWWIHNYKIELSFLSQGKDKAEKPSERSWWDGTETQSSERRFLFAHQPAGAQHNVPEAVLMYLTYLCSRRKTMHALRARGANRSFHYYTGLFSLFHQEYFLFIIHGVFHGAKVWNVA